MESIETAIQIRTGKVQKLSIQQVIDCAWQFVCDDGGIYWAWNYLAKAENGIMSEDDYPFISTVKGSCRYDPSKNVANLKNFFVVNGWFPIHMFEALQVEPVIVGVKAYTQAFQLYKSGILSDQSCPTYDPDHLMLVVGWGSEDGKDYYIVKNSWGTYWGENGYIRIEAMENSPGICGVQ